jgi:hypothetical protein
MEYDNFKTITEKILELENTINLLNDRIKLLEGADGD